MAKKRDEQVMDEAALLAASDPTNAAKDPQPASEGKPSEPPADPDPAVSPQIVAEDDDVRIYKVTNTLIELPDRTTRGDGEEVSSVELGGDGTVEEQAMRELRYSEAEAVRLIQVVSRSVYERQHAARFARKAVETPKVSALERLKALKPE